MWKLCGWRLRAHAHRSQIVLDGNRFIRLVTWWGTSLFWASVSLAESIFWSWNIKEKSTYFSYIYSLHLQLRWGHETGSGQWDRKLPDMAPKICLETLSLFSSILQSKNWRKYRSLNHSEQTHTGKLPNPPKTVLGRQLWVVLSHWNLFCFCTDYSSTEEAKEWIAFYKDESR